MKKKILTKNEFINQLKQLKAEHAKIKKMFKQLKKHSKVLARKADKLYWAGDLMYDERWNDTLGRTEIVKPYKDHSKNMDYLNTLSDLDLIMYEFEDPICF